MIQRFPSKPHCTMALSTSRGFGNCFKPVSLNLLCFYITINSEIISNNGPNLILIHSLGCSSHSNRLQLQVVILIIIFSVPDFMFYWKLLKCCEREYKKYKKKRQHASGVHAEEKNQDPIKSMRNCHVLRLPNSKSCKKKRKKTTTNKKRKKRNYTKCMNTPF